MLTSYLIFFVHLRNISLTSYFLSGYRYFLNIDRWAYENLNIKKIYGARIFATDPQCNRVYYYTKSGWSMYKSARWDLNRDVFCSRQTNSTREFKQVFSKCEQGSIGPTSYATFSYTSRLKVSLHYSFN